MRQSLDLAFGEVELRQRLTADRKACVGLGGGGTRF